MGETCKSIGEWSQENFGGAGSNAVVVARANEEMAELVKAVAYRKPIDEIMEEAADVVIVLCRLAHRNNLDLFAELELRATSKEDTDRQALSLRIVAAANQDMALLVQGIAAERIDRDLIRLSRGFVMALRTLGAVNGRILWEAISKKMAINRAREWTVDASGNGYHKRHDGEAAHA